MNLLEVEKISYEVMSWCSIYFGKSKYHKDYPMIFVRYELNKKSKCYGEYDWQHNVIFIYTKLNQTTSQLINTVIHEYVHYLQSPVWSARYLKKYSSRLNPYECVAEITARELSKDCEKEIGSKIKRIIKRRKNGNTKPNRS